MTNDLVYELENYQCSRHNIEDKKLYKKIEPVILNLLSLYYRHSYRQTVKKTRHFFLNSMSSV